MAGTKTAEPARTIPWYVAAVVVTALTTVAGLMTYWTLPPEFPLIWGEDGRVEVWTETTLWTAFSGHTVTAVFITAAAVLTTFLPRILARIFKSMTPDALMLKAWGVGVLRLILAKASLAVSLGGVVSFVQTWFYPTQYEILFGFGMAVVVVAALAAIVLPAALSFACMVDREVEQSRLYFLVGKYLGPAQ